MAEVPQEDMGRTPSMAIVEGKDTMVEIQQQEIHTINRMAEGLVQAMIS